MSISLLLCLRLERAVQSANGLDDPEQVRVSQQVAGEHGVSRCSHG